MGGRLVLALFAHTAEVDDLDAVAVVHDVRRLHVPVHEALLATGVQMHQRFEDLAAVRGHVLDVEDGLPAPGLLDDLVEGAVADVVHDDVATGDPPGGVAPGDEVADLDDAGVADGDEVAAFHVGQPGAVVLVAVE